MAFEVELLPHALVDLDHIVDWLKKRSPSGAKRWLDAWIACIEYLEHYADHCQVAPESERCAATIRQVIFRTRRGNPYRALFVIRGAVVQVLHIRGFGQDLVSEDDLRLPDSP